MMLVNERKNKKIKVDEEQCSLLNQEDNIPFKINELFVQTLPA